ncbi:tRNA (adenosine(37)-N6)-threonylcarbamoyltransferase complex dimerization subunit type 1 TsaB [Dokdonella koreensis]|uniref:tRNA threonylcarbamoyladenosine biosynthesis protein TsaB n=1 Tax=Dokdonella koreensis DS-123 TaxID=1300342 RepID=A0A167G8A3_9GAMM|nr:tRNA (adenosine(37)-N6)-threonylcarbamoyltransferase complex dimerization subunit type 1 TsaB [Dokdonella koreensis]ANB16254.1 Peptidase M22 glycoprotease [Dokdonella koreensis DS-123]
MNLLAIETATEACSAAVLTAAGIVERFEIAPRRHAELLLPMCEAVLAEAGITRRQLDAIAVGRGPGAFTGVRLAISAAQGVALALDLPVVPVSSLAALALEAPAAGQDATLAVIDARMGEVYAGCFRPTADGLVEAFGEETVGPAAAVVLPAAAGWAVVGTGWLAWPDALRAHLPGEPLFAAGERFPRASSIARLAAPIAKAGRGVAPELALPVYLRDKVALTLDEQGRR